jgi:hypothetical protein
MQHSGISSVEHHQQARLSLGVSEKEDGYDLGTKASVIFWFSLICRYIMQDLAILSFGFIRSTGM